MLLERGKLLEQQQKELLLWGVLYDGEVLLIEQKDYWGFLRNNTGILHGVIPVQKLCGNGSIV